MADEVVGRVTVDVHGNTDPLKDDVRRAAVAAGKSINDGVGEGAGGTAITDNIVDQVGDAERPSEREGQKVGKAIARGVEIGTSDIDLKAQLNEDLKKAEAPLRIQAEKIGRAVSRATREAREKAADRAIEDTIVRIRIDNDPLQRQFTDTQREFSEFARSLDDAFDRAFQPIWKRAWARLSTTDGGAGGAGQRSGKQMGQGIETGLSNHIKGSGFISKITNFVAKAFAGVALKGTFLAFGARAGIALGGGLLTELATVGQAAAGLVSGIVGSAGQALIGLGTVAGGTFATAFAGGYATVLTSIAAVMPAVKGLSLAFKGMEKEEKKALEDRLKAATENLKGFGRAVRAELLPAVFDSLKSLDKLVPTLNTFGTSLGDAAGDAVRSFTKMATSGKMIDEIGTFLNNSVGYFRQLSDAGIGLAATIIPAFNAISPVTKRFFGDVSDAIGSLADKITDLTESGDLEATLSKWYDRAKSLITTFATFGGAIGKVFDVAADARGDQFLDSLQKMADSFDLFIDKVAGNGTLEKKLAEWYDSAATIGRAFGNLGKIVLLFFDTAASAGGTFLEDFESTTERWLEQFEQFRSGGGLGDTLKDWFEQGKLLIEVMGNLGSVVVNVFGAAAKAGDGVLENLERITQGWADWTNSVTGQNTLHDYFEEARPVIEEVWGLLGDVLKLFAGSFTGDTDNLTQFIKSIREEWIPTIEDIQDTLRSSGVQDQLYDLVKAFSDLLRVTGGSLAGFLTVIAQAIELLASAIQLLGPLGPVIAMFLGAMKGFAAIKWVATAVGLGKFTGAFSTMVTTMRTAGGVGAGLGSLAGKIGKFNIAMAGLTAITGVNALFNDKAVAQIEKYDQALKDTTKTVEEILDQPWSTAGDDVEDFGTTMEELQWRLGGLDGVQGKLAGLFAGLGDALGFGITEEAISHIDGLLGSIQNLANTGDWTTVGTRLAETEQMFEDSGIDAEHYAGKIDRLKESIGELVRADFTPQIDELLNAGNWEGAATLVGNFAVALHDAGVDAETAAGLVKQLRDEIVALGETDVVDINIEGLGAAQKEIDKLKESEKYFSGGEWTKAGKKARDDLLAGLFSEDLGAAVQAELDAIPKTLEFFDPAKGGYTAEGIELVAKIKAEADYGTINGVKDAIDQATEDEIVAIYADPAHYNRETGELKDEFKSKVVELTMRGVARAKKDLKEVKDTGGVIPMKLRLQGVGIDPQTGHPSGKPGTYGPEQTEVTMTVDTAIAKQQTNAFWTDTKGTPLVAPLDIDKTEAREDIKTLREALKDNPMVVPIKWDIPPLPNGTVTTDSEDSGGSGSPTNPGGARGNMFSPGAPTTMGAYQPLTVGERANIISSGDSGVVGSPNYYSNQDKDKISKNVTINNYYPEPERASDTIAMQMRIARYA